MTLILGVLLASALGSIHCAAMCGGFVCVYAGAAPRGLRGLPAHAAYNLGRLVSYLALGMLAGAIGGRLDRIGLLVGIGRGAAVAAGTLMVAWALSALAASAGIRVPGTVAPEWPRRTLGAALVALRDRPPAARAAATGLVTTLLPCGWLYTFVATATGTGSAAMGALVMLAFWAGTVPLLLAAGFGARGIIGPLTRRLPALSAVLVLALGLLSIAGKLQPPNLGAGSPHALHGPHVHH